MSDTTTVKRQARPMRRAEGDPPDKDKKDKEKDKPTPDTEQRETPPPRPDKEEPPKEKPDKGKEEVKNSEDNPADDMLPGARALAETRAALDGAASVIQSHIGRQENAAVREHLAGLQKGLAEARTATAAALGEHYPDVEMEYDDIGMDDDVEETAEQRDARKRGMAQFWRNVAKATAVVRSSEAAELAEIKPLLERLVEEAKTNRMMMKRMRGEDVLPKR